MEFITEEVKKELGLTDDMVNGIKPLYDNHIAEAQKGWDGKANENAEKILDGAALKVSEATGVQRNQGEKVAEYIIRANGEFKTDLEKKKSEYEKKLSEFDGGKSQKEELEKLKSELDTAKQTLAEFDIIKAKADKLEPLETEYKSMKKQIAFQSVKPNFPETVNAFEAKARWEDFVKKTEEKYTIELVENEAVCKDKENEYKTVKLKDLVDKDEELTKLLQGRQQKGTSSSSKEKETITGVPFEVPKDATSVERTEAIKEYLLKEGIALTSTKYSEEFAKYNKLILDGGKK